VLHSSSSGWATFERLPPPEGKCYAGQPARPFAATHSAAARPRRAVPAAGAAGQVSPPPLVVTAAIRPPAIKRFPWRCSATLHGRRGGQRATFAQKWHAALVTPKGCP